MVQLASLPRLVEELSPVGESNLQFASFFLFTYR